MDITYAGGPSFLLKGETSVAINPAPRAEGAVLTLHSVRQRSQSQIINGPGEYEIRGVLVTTLETGPAEDRTLVHAVELGGINVVHLAGKPALSERDLRDLGTVDVLLVNADDRAAAEVAIRDLEPRVVVPFGVHGAAVAAQMAGKELEPQTRLSWNGTGTPPRAVLLKAPGTRRRSD